MGCESIGSSNRGDTEMTLVVYYPSKKELKASVGTRLKASNPSIFDSSVPTNGVVYGCNRPHLTGFKREFFAQITLQDGVIVKVA